MACNCPDALETAASDLFWRHDRGVLVGLLDDRKVNKVRIPLPWVLFVTIFVDFRRHNGLYDVKDGIYGRRSEFFTVQMGVINSFASTVFDFKVRSIRQKWQHVLVKIGLINPDRRLPDGVAPPSLDFSDVDF